MGYTGADPGVSQLTVKGTDSKLTTNDLNVAASGYSANVVVQDGGNITVNNDLSLGGGKGSGIVTVSGNGANALGNLQVTGSVKVNQNGNLTINKYAEAKIGGDLSIQNKGTVVVNGAINKPANLSVQGKLNVYKGGTMTIDADDDVSITGLTTIYAGASVTVGPFATINTVGGGTYIKGTYKVSPGAIELGSKLKLKPVKNDGKMSFLPGPAGDTDGVFQITGNFIQTPNRRT